LLKSVTYIIYFNWKNTKDNHAGMSYFFKAFKEKEPNIIRLIEIPQSINSWPIIVQRLYFYGLAFWIKQNLKVGDKVIFAEFLGNISGNQTGLAIKLRKWGVQNKFFGLVHLSGKNLLELYGSYDYIKEGIQAVNTILVFGSSLESFFKELGFGHKTVKTFHYVDTNYYKPNNLQKKNKLQVIHLGSIKRNFEKLKEIVISCPDIDFHICQGHQDLSEYFNNIKNVTLYVYLSEEDLLKLMQSCHISLSILDDTIGSNVITTSMACGLVNVASDVGSIRDYCSPEDSFLCQTKDDFVTNVNLLASSQDLLSKMKNSAIEKSKLFSLNKSISEFNKIIQT